MRSTKGNTPLSSPPPFRHAGEAGLGALVPTLPTPPPFHIKKTLKKGSFFTRAKYFALAVSLTLFTVSAVQRIQENLNPAVSIQPSQWVWLRAVSLKLDQTPSTQTLVEFRPSPIAPPSFTARSRPKVRLTTHRDQIRVVAAAPVVAKKVEPAAQVVASAAPAEIDRLRSVHFALQRRFQAIIARGEIPQIQKNEMSIQVAQAAPKPSAPPVLPAVVKQASKPQALPKAAVLKAELKVEKPKVQPPQSVTTQKALPLVKLEAPQGAPYKVVTPVKPHASVQPEPIEQATEAKTERPATAEAAATSQPTPIKAAAAAKPQPKTDLVQPPTPPPPAQTSRCEYSPASTVEAFFPESVITQSTIEEMTREPSTEGCPNGWWLSKSKDHWSTLSWRSATTQGDFKTLPMISGNTGRLLEHIARTSIAREAGIVFGKVPAGWTVALSGRAEAPIYLNSERQPVEEHDVERERSFAFVNASLGAQLIYLVNEKTHESGAFAVPVLRAVATYIDLSTVRKIRLSGTVFSAERARPTPVRGARVTVVGQGQVTRATGGDGSFVMSEVLAVPGYPLHLEARGGSNGYVHRYRLIPSRSGLNSRLFLFNNLRIEHWVSQLEGGISSSSGIAIAAVTTSKSDQKLFPVVRSLMQNPTLDPESYVLSSSGDLTSEGMISGSQPTFVSMQIPEGVTIARAEGENKKIFWAELFFSSPGVLNVLGSY